ncbi:MAG: hypothetical protein PHO42_05640 [Candidatus Omnitrophica bacterium]|nr:hypothetical protein [Candidatus Omnitrophota bacterium]
MIGAAITVFVAVIAVTLYLMAQAAWYDTNATLDIQREANLGMERVLRGFKAASDAAPRGLLDAKSFAVDGSGNISFTSGIDLKERRFYSENNQLMYDPDTAIGGDEIAILGNVTTFRCAASSQNPAKIVLIDLGVSKKIRAVEKIMNLSGVAVLRNA